MINRLRCLVGSHTAIQKFDRWEHSASGAGFNVSTCRYCGVEMTKRGGGQWRAVDMGDRP